jgi:hypothetical protein
VYKGEEAMIKEAIAKSATGKELREERMPLILVERKRGWRWRFCVCRKGLKGEPPRGEREDRIRDPH